MHSPSIIQIISGSKRLFWKDNVIDVSHSKLLLSDASASLSFENLPQKGRFLSRVFSFHCLPPESMLELSRNNGQGEETPLLSATSGLQDILNALFSFDQYNMSNETRTFWVMGFYQQLAEIGALHQLFSDVNTLFSQKLSRYLSLSPSEEHALETIVDPLCDESCHFDS